jgi:methionyl-tRNA formyltransferase
MSKPKALKVFISGQKYFGGSILRLCIDMGLTVVGVCCPPGDKYIGRLAAINEIKIIPSGSLSYETMPDNVDIGISAHSFDYVGKKTRYKPTYGWIGYHPSLLPRHRGRSAIEWAIRMRDPITGGTVFWLNSGIDRGDIAAQKWVWIEPKYFIGSPRKAASDLWRDKLLGLGVELMRETISDITNGKFIRIPQQADVSTWEPSTDVNDIFRPDLLMLPPPTKSM